MLLTFRPASGVEFTLKVHTKPNGEVRPQAKNVRVLHGDGKVRQNRFLTLGDKITADGGYLELKPAEWRKICEFLCRVDEGRLAILSTRASVLVRSWRSYFRFYP